MTASALSKFWLRGLLSLTFRADMALVVTAPNHTALTDQNRRPT